MKCQTNPTEEDFKRTVNELASQGNPSLEAWPTWHEKLIRTMRGSFGAGQSCAYDT